MHRVIACLGLGIFLVGCGADDGIEYVSDTCAMRRAITDEQLAQRCKDTVDGTGDECQSENAPGAYSCQGDSICEAEQRAAEESYEVAMAAAAVTCAGSKNVVACGAAIAVATTTFVLRAGQAADKARERRESGNGGGSSGGSGSSTGNGTPRGGSCGANMSCGKPSPRVRKAACDYVRADVGDGERWFDARTGESKRSPHDFAGPAVTPIR